MENSFHSTNEKVKIRDIKKKKRTTSSMCSKNDSVALGPRMTQKSKVGPLQLSENML